MLLSPFLVFLAQGLILLLYFVLGWLLDILLDLNLDCSFWVRFLVLLLLEHGQDLSSDSFDVAQQVVPNLVFLHQVHVIFGHARGTWLIVLIVVVIVVILRDQVHLLDWRRSHLRKEIVWHELARHEVLHLLLLGELDGFRGLLQVHVVFLGHTLWSVGVRRDEGLSADQLLNFNGIC